MDEFLHYAKMCIKRTVILARQVYPLSLYRRYQARVYREQAEQVLASFSVNGSNKFDGHVLVDAMWDNPNYWIRYAMLRAALGLSMAREVGILGPYRAKFCRRTLERFGISEILNVSEFRTDPKVLREAANHLLAQTKAAADILGWQLPYDVPADFVYDGILKRQRSASVDLHDVQLPVYVSEALGSIAAADSILKAYKPDLVVLSHTVNFQGSAFAWLAVQRGIPVVLLFGNYGVSRFVKLIEPSDLYDTADRPERADLYALPSAKARAMADAGVAYLDRRWKGETDDIGAKYAFQKATHKIDRLDILQRFRWEPNRPIIAVYAANWFDFPHPCGMTSFRDFLDWLEETLGVAVRNTRVSWLFRAHPCDEHYGGIKLTDLMSSHKRYSHIRIAPREWNGSSVLDAVDGVITYHGTVGIEAAALGKPVLVADVGWYHDAGFVKWPRSRQEYLDDLAKEWWKDLDIDATTRKARVFAGWYFCRPAWQGSFVLQDDSIQWPIYKDVPKLFADNRETITREVRTISKWFYSKNRRYHTYKMRISEDFTS